MNQTMKTDCDSRRKENLFCKHFIFKKNYSRIFLQTHRISVRECWCFFECCIRFYIISICCWNQKTSLVMVSLLQYLHDLFLTAYHIHTCINIPLLIVTKLIWSMHLLKVVIIYTLTDKRCKNRQTMLLWSKQAIYSISEYTDMNVPLD